MIEAIAAGALSAGAQWMVSEQARQANAQERKAMKGLIDRIQDPSFDPKELTPEQYQVAAKYVPEMAQFVEEVAPKVVTQSADQAQGKRAQREALERLSEIGSSTGIDPQMQALSNEAARRSQTEAQSRQRSILQDAERRGQGSSASTIAAQLMGASEGMDRAAQTQNNLAAQAYQQRLQALAESGQLGGQLAQQDVQLQKTNADIINDFNQRNTARRQSYLSGNANTMNQAQMYNVGQMQDVGNRNVQNRNQFAQANQSRADDIEKNRYNAQVNRTNMLQGLSAQNMQANTQRAADTNQAIQGATNVAGAYAQSNAQDNRERMKQDREDQRQDYQMAWDRG